jgi:hypothetical protein
MQPQKMMGFVYYLTRDNMFAYLDKKRCEHQDQYISVGSHAMNKLSHLRPVLSSRLNFYITIFNRGLNQ